MWLAFSPHTGHEQGGRRPALTLSSDVYNKKVGLAIFCPVTSQAKGYPFEVPIPAGLKISGVALSDQVKNFDWQSRKSEFCCRVPESTVSEVLEKLETLLGV